LSLAPSVSAAKPPNAPSTAAAPDPRPAVRPLPQAPPAAPSAVALPATPAGFASLIVAAFPALFGEGAPKKSLFSRPTPPGISAEYRVKRFTLLWRGSRDGFGAREFHARCDGHAPTLTLIEVTKGEHFRRLHAGGVGVTFIRGIQGGSEPDEFSFSAGESVQFPDEDICAEGRKEERSNPL
jgi:hypothetical protein